MLSGGEQRRALVSGGELILADEPTGNLDSGNGENIIGILKELAHTSERCVVVITHDHSVASRADEVLRMRDGRLELPA